MIFHKLQRRLLSSRRTIHPHVKQVTRANFAECLQDIKPQIASSHFIAVSVTKTGAHSSAWHKVLSYDSPEIAFRKSKYAAERFQVLQLAVCPFTFADSKLTAHPYIFNLFPRDELNIGMPCYSFTCQPSFLSTLVAQGFDFNTCIYEGLSYLSREQESAAKIRLGNLLLAAESSKSSSPPSVADSVFIERVKHRVQHWRDVCKESNNVSNEKLLNSLKKLVVGAEEYNSRPSLCIDVSNDRQAVLVVELMQQLSDNLTPLLVQRRGGAIQSIRVVFTASKEDKDLLLKDLHETEDMHNKKLSGFREVIDAISDSQNPLVFLNSLDDITFIYSKFIGSLPSTVDGFLHSLRTTFPRVIDVSNLLSRVLPTKKGKPIAVSMNQLKSRFFAPIDLEIPSHVSWEDDRIHDHNVVATAQTLAKLLHILKNDLDSDPYANMFGHGELEAWSNNTRDINFEKIVFLWGFAGGIPARTLKEMLQGWRFLLNAEFDVRLVEKNCAAVMFCDEGTAEMFKGVVGSGVAVAGKMKEVFPDGLKAAGYERYDEVCKLGVWEPSLVEALEKVLLLSSSECAFFFSV